MITIAREHPVQDDLALLHQRHTEAMHAETPPESIHMLPADALAAPGIAFFVMREAGQAIGMGAVKRIDDSHAEIKSMHVLAETRGRGLAKTMLDHLIAEARAQGFTRLSLETGVEGIFAPARALYLRAGFAECGPFADYREDPNSIFMSLRLA
ncbi:putative acetyltransferase [Gemmobacter aquatilis]|uniref:Putative acetyltransferase n=1 Tax=Gemmobacter aquatilis TaxID=933059 RepID=A0A1H8E737_9RHOB|nr:GNAT family N-acetyltransferase [Gemmobacter aquatilis]SEN14934.1 putative acetyltransferase [Gemmobacter aquatilis]